MKEAKGDHNNVKSGIEEDDESIEATKKGAAMPRPGSRSMQKRRLLFYNGGGLLCHKIEIGRTRFAFIADQNYNIYTGVEREVITADEEKIRGELVAAVTTVALPSPSGGAIPIPEQLAATTIAFKLKGASALAHPNLCLSPTVRQIAFDYGVIGAVVCCIELTDGAGIAAQAVP